MVLVTGFSLFLLDYTNFTVLLCCMCGGCLSDDEIKIFSGEFRVCQKHCVN